MYQAAAVTMQWPEGLPKSKKTRKLKRSAALYRPQLTWPSFTSCRKLPQRDPGYEFPIFSNPPIRPLSEQKPKNRRLKASEKLNWISHEKFKELNTPVPLRSISRKMIQNYSLKRVRGNARWLCDALSRQMLRLIAFFRFVSTFFREEK